MKNRRSIQKGRGKMQKLLIQLYISRLQKKTTFKKKANAIPVVHDDCTLHKRDNDCIAAKPKEDVRKQGEEIRDERREMGLERREKRVGSWRREMEEKRKTTNWTIQRKAIKKWADRGLLKKTFRHQEAYKMSPKTSPTGSLIFCCHKCHSLRYKILNKRKIE